MLFDLLCPGVADHGKEQARQPIRCRSKDRSAASTIRRMKAGESVSTNTLDALCKILQCDLAGCRRIYPRK